ncbi:unnamed protein product [Moneuplotes crassus]|uniref:Transmembrane protein n=1 Tax=Euplotes crassus TaxID=5936 RepID=A0AAD1XYD9_EUPCR|nr:unnamed protein product [Moneuplotes crassus]
MKEIFFLSLLITLSVGNTCQNDQQTMKAPISGSIEISTSTFSVFYGILEHPDQESLYFIGKYSDGTSFTIIYQTDYNLRKKKAKKYEFQSTQSGFAIATNGNFIYIVGINPTPTIYEIETNDLGIRREISGTSGYSIGFSNLEVYGSLYFNMESGSVIETCKWDRETTNLNCVNFGINKQSNFVPISNETLFVSSSDSALDQHYFIAYNFSDTSNLVWKKSIACLPSDCESALGKFILSKDRRAIFTMIVYDEHFLFYKLNATDGSPQNPGFISSSNSAGRVCSMREFNDFIAIQIHSSSFQQPFRLIKINIANTNVIQEFESTNPSVYGIARAMSLQIEVIYYCGGYSGSNKLFFARSPITNINQLSQFEKGDLLFTQITTNYQVSSTISDPSLTSSSKIAEIPTTPSITGENLPSAISPTTTTSVALWNEDHLQSVPSNYFTNLTFTWACSPSSNPTQISFSLTQTAPTPSLTGSIYLLQPKSFTCTRLQCSMLLRHFISLFRFLSECKISNCDTCKLGEPTTCESCKDNFQLSNDHKSCSSTLAPTLATTTAITLIAASIIMASISSILSFSSINSIFSMINSLQLAMLLPMVPEYFSMKVMDFLDGMSFSMLSFDFVRIGDAPGVEVVTGWMEYPQTDEYLESLGMSSGSSIVNYLSLAAFVGLIIMVNSCVLICKKCANKSENEKFKKATGKLFEFFTFNIYIRMFIQSFVFIILCSLSELYNMNLKTTTTKASFLLSSLFTLLSTSLLLLSLYMYAKSFPEVDNEKYWTCKEFFNGVRSQKYSNFYSTIFLLVRLMLISLIIFGKTMSPFYRATAFYSINILYGVYLLIIRPFENPQDNMIENINQILFCCLTIPLSWLNIKSDWTAFYETLYISILTSSPLIGSLISLIFLFKSIITYFKPKKPSSKVQILPELTTPSPQPRTPHIWEERKANPSIHKYSSDLPLQNSEIESTIHPPLHSSNQAQQIETRQRNIDHARMLIEQRVRKLC